MNTLAKTAATPVGQSGPERPTPAPNRQVVPVRHVGRGLFTVVVALIVVQVLVSLATNEHIKWSVVGEFMLSPAILNGLKTTLIITLISSVLAMLLAVIAAVMRMSQSRIVSGVAFLYVFVFRGVPLIVLLILVGNLGLFVKEFSLGIPFTDVVFFSVPVSRVVTPLVASIIGLTLAASAYMSEIVRGGLLSVSSGQRQAAMALGLNKAQALRHIIIPQALRVIIPPMGNEFINTLKASALVSVIAGGDLLTVAMGISGVNYRTIELLFVATFWYLIIIVISSIGQYLLERRTAEK